MSTKEISQTLADIRFVYSANRYRAKKDATGSVRIQRKSPGAPWVYEDGTPDNLSTDASCELEGRINNNRSEDERQLTIYWCKGGGWAIGTSSEIGSQLRGCDILQDLGFSTEGVPLACADPYYEVA